jgi:hypothetical protein
LYSPMNATNTNHKSIIGEKAKLTLLVPYFSLMNRRIKITTLRMTT